MVLDPDGNVVHDCGTGELVTLTRTDQIVEVRLAGGAGFGDPRARTRRWWSRTWRKASFRREPRPT